MTWELEQDWVPGGGGTPGNSCWGCAARFSKSWPYFRPKHSGGDSAYERGGDARRKFWIKPLKETDLGVAQAFLTPKRDHVNDPKGRWRVDGGIEVPVKIEMEAARSSIRELKDEPLKLGIRARIKQQACEYFSPWSNNRFVSAAKFRNIVL